LTDTKKLKRNFDIHRYLEDRGVPFDTEGDNVSPGWLGVKCIFCNDHADHLGINLEKKNISCWICGVTGDVVDLIMELERVSFRTACQRLEEYKEGFGSFSRQQEKAVLTKRRRGRVSLLPTGFKAIERGREPPLVKEYFARRGFDLSLCQKYGLGFVSYGEYQLMLIVPVYLDGMLVSFQAMDMTGKGRAPYIDCPEDRAIVYNKHMLYGVDDITDSHQVIVVEGVTDKWATGKDALGLFGKNYTIQQLRLLKERAVDKIIKVLLDADAVSRAKRLAKDITAVTDTPVFLVELDELERDPAAMEKSYLDDIVAY